MFVARMIENHKRDWNPAEARDFIDAYLQEIEKVREPECFPEQCSQRANEAILISYCCCKKSPQTWCLRQPTFIKSRLGQGWLFPGFRAESTDGIFQSLEATCTPELMPLSSIFRAINVASSLPPSSRILPMCSLPPLTEILLILMGSLGQPVSKSLISSYLQNSVCQKLFTSSRDQNMSIFVIHYSAYQRVGKIETLFQRVLLVLLSHFSHVRLCVTSQMTAHQAPLSLGFSKQEHQSGLPFPSPVYESEK